MRSPKDFLLQLCKFGDNGPQMNRNTLALCVVLTAIACSLAHAQNLETGDSVALKAHIASPGVIDADGKNHEGKAGWTLPRVDVVPNYTNVRNSAKPGEFCYFATAHPQFTTDPAMRMLDWQPKGCNVCACNFDRDRWMEGISGHEAHHAADDIRLVSEANARLKKQRPLQVKACFSKFDPNNEQAAALSFSDQFSAAMAMQLENLKRQIDREQAIYDKRAIGDDPQCGNCKPCGPTEVAQCNQCGMCNSATGICEAKPNCTPPPTCCCRKYVVGQQACQVGTIEQSACESMNVTNAVTAQCGNPCTTTEKMCGEGP